MLAAILRNAPRTRCGRRGGSDRRGRRIFLRIGAVGGDAYVLKDIVHDWDESKVLEILRNVRNAVSAGAKLLVIETVIHPTTIASSCPNCWIWKCWSPAPGKERTAAEYTHLLNRAGFCNMRVIPTVGPVSVVESEAA